MIGLVAASAFLVAGSDPEIELELKSLLDDKIEIKIPKDFEIMTEEMMKVKYPSKQRPNLVYTNDMASVNLGINHTASTADQTMIPAYGEALKGSLEKAHAGSVTRDHGVKEVNGRKVAYIKIVTPAVDTKIFNYMVLTDLENRLLICSFNCKLEDEKKWAAKADEIMNSLKVK